MRGTLPIYNLLVNRVPGIRERYIEKRKHAIGMKRCGVWAYLLGLNFSYYVLRNRDLEHPVNYPYFEGKKLLFEKSESAYFYRKTPAEFAVELKKYDVISFDVFDTLIFRPFSEPTDLFYLLGEKLDYPDFKRIRQEMEWNARREKYKKEGHYEINLNEIYDILSEETGIDGSYAKELELEMEAKYCFANPYMKNVVTCLRNTDKRLVITTDMYLSEIQIRFLLEQCGYPEFDAYYVSSELGKSKSKGDLYDVVLQNEKKCLEKTDAVRMAHIGDNLQSDVEHAQKKGIEAIHYPNVNEEGKKFRPYDMSVITGSVYRGVVNACLHNGMHCFTREYEYGYVYGGLFVTGYCQFIHQYVTEKQVDKILFLARDGSVLSQAYHILYPDEDGRAQYVLWSRLAATKMSANHFKYDYFRRFLYHKVNQGYRIRQILHSMELDDLLDSLCKQENLTPDSALTDQNVGHIKRYLLQHWEQIIDCYQPQVEAGEMYYAEILEDCRSALAVDIGWAGSGAITLDYIVNHIWNLDCKIIGAVAGTNTCHNSEPDSSETFLQTGQLVSYLYSQRENRDIWKYHNPGNDHNLYWEMLLDAPVGSFVGFYPNRTGGCDYRFKRPTSDLNRVKRMQEGIFDFVKQWKTLFSDDKRMGTISGRDAYAPMVIAENEKNKSYMKYFIDMEDDVNL